MPIPKSIPEVTFNQAMEAMLGGAKANIPILLIGDPGVGKTALTTLVAEKLGLPLVTVLGSTLDPTDIGGALVVRKDKKGVDRVPLEIIRQACEKPVLLFLDEISCAPPVVQASLLRLILERVAGDTKLHPETIVFGACNPPEQAPGGFELSAPLIGRVTMLYLRPSHEEVTNFFMGYGQDGTELRNQAVDFASICSQAADLLQIDIPKAAVTGSIPWGAPRSWERAIKARAAAVEAQLSDTTLHCLTAGAVGEEVATSYSAILKLRNKLPSVEEILKAPDKAKVPDAKKEQIAAIGLMPRIAKQNSWAAWVYAERLAPEIGVACVRLLMGSQDSPINLPFAKEGVSARVNMTHKIKAV